MARPGPDPEVSVDEALAVFTGSDPAWTPYTASEVGERLGCSRRTAHRKLEALEDRGELASKKTGARSRVWWYQGEGDDRTGDDPELAQFGEFVRAVEDYAIFMLDPDGHVASWNAGAERLKGYAREEIVGEHFSTFYTAEAVETGVPDGNLRAAAARGRIEDEGWRVRQDGSRFWANVVITAIHDADGELRGFTKVTRDMTERRENEQRLERERDFNRQVLETVPVGVTVIEPDGSFVRANSRALERLGLSEPELGEHSPDDWPIYDENGEPIAESESPWWRAFETGESVYDFRCRIDLDDLGHRWLSINAAPLADREDEFGDRVVIAVEDVTELVEHERELRRERNQTEQLLQTAPMAVTVRDVEGNRLRTNERARELFGWENDQGTFDEADSSPQLYDDDGRPIDVTETPTARAIRTGEAVYDEELAVETDDGERYWYAVNAAPIVEDGELTRVVSAAEEITDLKRRERRLERRKGELETELGEILGRVSDAFYALDADWRFTHVNDQAEELLGRSSEGLVGTTFWEAFPGAREGEFGERFREAVETQEPVSFQARFSDPDGWLQVTAYPSETGLSVYFRDVTERVERERELERYRTIVETVNDGIYTVDQSGEFTMVNDAYVEMTGYSRGELLGSHVSLVVDEETIQQSTSIEDALAQGDADSVKLEADVLRADGGRVPAEATFSLFEADEGYQRVGVVRDLTERVERERALEESERRYRSLVENFPNGGVGVFDRDLRYTLVDGTMWDDIALDSADLEGETVRDALPDHTADDVEPLFRAALEGETDSVVSTLGGRDFRVWATPLRDADDEVVAGQSFAVDITEQLEREEELEESNERLEQFAYVASHDLQEPLRMVSNYLQLLERRYGDDLEGEAHEFIDYAVDGAERMRQMINDLLAYSRVQTDPNPFGPTDAEAVVDRVLEGLHVRIEETDAEVTVGDLPTVVADESQFEQVFQNLVSNAIKYAADDPPRIEIDAERGENEVVFSVADEGIGIEPEYQDRVFDVFDRLHTSEEYSGTGIGLALCERIVERHGGDIWVESAAGQGATFYFSIPNRRHSDD